MKNTIKGFTEFVKNKIFSNRSEIGVSEEEYKEILERFIISQYSDLEDVKLMVKHSLEEQNIEKSDAEIEEIARQVQGDNK